MGDGRCEMGDESREEMPYHFFFSFTLADQSQTVRKSSRRVGAH